MTKQTTDVANLKKYYKTDTSLDPTHLVEELNGESDRAVVILLGTILDDFLTIRIKNCPAFKNIEAKHDKAIFRFEGPLGSFSARIEIAQLFGVTDAMTSAQLNIVREMRNACAHSRRKIDFSVPQLANVARRMFSPFGSVTLPTLPTDVKLASRLIRAALTAEAAILQYILKTNETRYEATKFLLAGVPGFDMFFPSPNTQAGP